MNPKENGAMPLRVNKGSSPREYHVSCTLEGSFSRWRHKEPNPTLLVDFTDAT